MSEEQGCLGVCVAKLQENGHHERAEYCTGEAQKLISDVENLRCNARSHIFQTPEAFVDIFPDRFPLR